MKLYLAVLIAAVTVNCLVTTINGTTATDTLTIPYTDMLLPPPLEDVQDNNGNGSGNSNDAAKNSFNVKKVVVTTTPTTASSSTTRKTIAAATKKPIKNDVTNILPELSIEALLPPLFEAKTEEEETDDKQEATKIDTTTTTTTSKPITTTTQRPTTTTTRRRTTARPTTTIKPSTTTTTLKPSNIEVPSLSLEALLPPLFDNTVDNLENSQNLVKPSTRFTTTTTTTTTTHKPLIDPIIYKTTKKSYYQQQQQTETKYYNKQKQQQQIVQNYPTINQDKQVAETKSQPQQVALPLQQQLQRNIERLTAQHAAQQTHYAAGNNDPRQHNYSFDFYLGSTTPKPPKSGLPTITPFPHRLGR